MKFEFLLSAARSAAKTIKRASRLRPGASLLVAAISAALLAACTPYQPAGLRGGFSETATAPATEVVNFSGNRFTSREHTKKMLLYRCAQVTRQNGFSYFIVTGDNRGFQVAGDSQSGDFPIPNTTSIQEAEVGFPGSMNEAYQDPLPAAAVSSMNEAYGEALPVEARPLSVVDDWGVLGAIDKGIDLEYEIKMFKGVKPANNPRAYYASDVLELLGPQLGLPTS